MHRKDRKAAKIRKKSRVNQMLWAGIIGAVAAVVGFGVYNYLTEGPSPTASFGAVGSTHEHAAFLVFINGEQVDFDQQKYQGKSRYMHLHPGNGATMHKHATGVDLGFFFDSIGIQFASDCLRMDNGAEYCNGGPGTLKFFVNGAVNSQYGEYVFRDGNRILISYGAEEHEQIDEQLKAVEELRIDITD
ncbi:MAG: hypothetical protein ACE5JV_01775 [Nitrososphaerales archaeon]